jgi:hypothetical protein
MFVHKAGFVLLSAAALVVSSSVISCTGARSAAPVGDRTGIAPVAASGGDTAAEEEREVLDRRREEERESPEEAATNRAMERAIEGALVETGKPAAWDDLHLITECTDDDGFRQVEVFGNGVTIWNRARQYALDPGRVRTLLEALDRAEFAEMEPMYGQEELDAAMRVICRVVVTLDGVTKQSGQLAEGPQNRRLKGLARTLLDSAFEPTEVGVTADDLDDGLRKVADGTLAPEALHVILNRKPDAFALSRGEPGYILRVGGRRASVQRLTADHGYEDAVEHTLDDAELSSLATLLAAQRIGDLPTNLYAVHYTDLVVEVLDRDQRIQARQFANTTRSTHGEAQERFDRAFEGLSGLVLRILGEA